MIRHAVLAALMLPCIASCSAPPPEATPAEVTQASADYRDCVAREAEGLDDFISSADAIGRAVASACEAWFDQFVVVTGRHLPPGAFLAYRNEMKRGEADIPTKHILRRRAEMQGRR